MLHKRTLLPELMDAPELEREPHWQALAGLARINRWSGSAALLWPGLAALARARQQPIRVLDVATGAGDVPIALVNRARRAGFSLQFDACDVSEDALAFADRRSERAGTPMRLFRCDVLAEDLPPGYDAVISSLFLHHVDDPQAVTVLARMARSATALVLVNDLQRGRTGWWLAYWGTRALSRSEIVHSDGPRSVERAFTVAEARALADKAGLDGAEVAPRWPCRWLLSWHKPAGWTPHGG